MQQKISPSMMCADIFALGETLDVFEKNAVDYLHIDVMDGHFVPNFTLGTDYCRLLRTRSDIPLDIHLMIEAPEARLDWFDIREGDYVSVHAETTHHLQRVLCAIRAKGARPMVALNPATPIDTLKYLLDDIDAVLVMTVNPGYSGQKLIPSTLGKIREIRDLLDESGHEQVEIEVDGNVSFEHAVRMRDAGANIYVVGSSSVFSKDMTLDEGISKFRNVIDS